MKAIVVMFDSLSRHMLPIYGCDWVHAPNFRRLAERAVTFERAYAGSLPCMPARREMHTGRYNFLHRSWGPIEPFDDSMPEILKRHGVRSHLVSDHYHYWEEGGCTYHTRYSAWQASRGQEGDPWKTDLSDAPHIGSQRFRTFDEWVRQDWVNRHYMQREEDTPQAKTFGMGLEFLRANHAADNWFLQLECFDPHEPYFVPQRYIDLYQDDYQGEFCDWPPYGPLKAESQDAVRHLRVLNAALVSMCDAYLGKVMDAMDELDLWRDTMLIVNTDHGFLLGEHDWWGKSVMPWYSETANIPLLIWDPRAGAAGRRREALVQTIDLPATLLDYFGAPLPADMQGVPLAGAIAEDTPVREAGLFGIFGGHVNVTDGRYVYMRGPANPENTPLYEHTLMPSHMRHTFAVQELQDIQLAEPFSFTKGCRLMKIASRIPRDPKVFATLLYDLETDPEQLSPIQDAAVERRMIDHLVRLMRSNDAPAEQFERLGLEGSA